MTKALDVPVGAFLSRSLDSEYPLNIVDALFTKVRTDKRVVSKALLIVSGIRKDGYREVLGLAMHPWVNTEAGLSAAGIPNIQNRDTSTTVGLHDGQTIVVGGLIK